MKPENKPVNFYLEVISSVYIGSNKTLSPYSDYVYNTRTEQIHYISHNKLFEELSKNISDRELDRIIERIYKSTNEKYGKNEKFTLDKLIFEQKISLDKITKHKVNCDVNPRTKQINRFVSSANKIYIPGSSIKGAISTAVYYDYFKNTEKGKHFIKYEFPDLLKRYKYSKDRKLKREMEYLQNPFGTDSRKSFFRFFHISDTDMQSPNDCIVIDEIKRVQKRKDALSKGTPIIAETLRPESIFYFTIKQTKYENIDLYDNIENIEYFKDFNIDKLLKLINQFSEDLIDYEIRKMPNINFLKEAKDDLKFLKSEIEKGETIIRLGAYKTFFFNTIMLLLPDSDFNLFRNIFKLGQNPKTKQLTKGNFPTTQAFLFDNGNAIEPGWCWISKE